MHVMMILHNEGDLGEQCHLCNYQVPGRASVNSLLQNIPLRMALLQLFEHTLDQLLTTFVDIRFTP